MSFVAIKVQHCTSFCPIVGMAALIWLPKIHFFFRKYVVLSLLLAFKWGNHFIFFLPCSCCVFLVPFVLPTAGNCSLTENVGLDGSSLMESSVQSIFCWSLSLLRSDELLPSPPVMELNHRAPTYCHSESENGKIAARNIPRLEIIWFLSLFQSVAARLWQDCWSELLNTNRHCFCSVKSEIGAARFWQDCLSQVLNTIRFCSIKGEIGSRCNELLGGMASAEGFFSWFQMQQVPFAALDQRGNSCRNASSSAVLHKRRVCCLPCCCSKCIPRADNCLMKAGAAVLVGNHFPCALVWFVPWRKFLSVWDYQISLCLLLPPDTCKHFCVWAH